MSRSRLGRNGGNVFSSARVSSGQLAQFCRQFGSYLNAGVDYSRTFSSLEKQFAGSALGPAIGRMRLAIKGGSTLEEAMAREPQIFSTMFLSMIRVAEARGGVPETLRMMGNHYEARQRLIRQARSAMIYPDHRADHRRRRGRPDHDRSAADVRRDAQGHRPARPRCPLPSHVLLGLQQLRAAGAAGGLFPLVLIGTPFLIYRFYKTAAGKAIDGPLAPEDSRSSARSAASSTPAGSPGRSRRCSTPAWTLAARST